jgi:hypothetical protein
MLTIFGSLVSLLPARYRKTVYVSSAAAFWSGLFEFLICLVLLIYRYFLFGRESSLIAGGDAILAVAEKAGDTAVMGSGLFMLVNYLFQPLTLLIAYFMVEGILRLSAALIHGEVVSTLPLHVLALLHQKLELGYAEHAAGPRVADEVERLTLTGDANELVLRIASCRAKQNWGPLMTIAYDDELFELARQEKDQTEPASPRPFIYFLRKKPEWKIVRGVHNYDPEEVLQERG